MAFKHQIKGDFASGLKDGIPIALGYISVSFAFGIFSVGHGVSVLEALLISMTNLTSAGQLAGVPIIAASGSLPELALSQLIINIRYSLMSVSLSQKLGDDVKIKDRFLISFGNTDEIFAVASAKKGKQRRSYFYGLILLPFIGWSSGTLIGALAGNALPQSIVSALGITIYGMFIAIIVPAAKEDRPTLICVGTAIALSCAFRYVHFLKDVSSGFVIIICAVVASALAAFLFPRNE